MDQKAFKGHLKATVFFIIFAIVQFSFFWGLCHLFPGERLYQRKARIKAGKPPMAAIVDPIKKSGVIDWRSEGVGSAGVDLAKRANEIPDREDTN